MYSSPVRHSPPTSCEAFVHRSEDHCTTSGISPSFPGLSQSKGLITHVLRTRAPLTIASPFDLHVLGLPPAFTLSQDQTLQLKLNG